MISKEAVYKYLSTGILTEGWFNFKEDEPQPDQNQDQNPQGQDQQNDVDKAKTDVPDLSWHFLQLENDLIIYAGSPTDPDAQYYSFADEIRYAEFKKDDDKKKNNNKSSKDNQDIFDKDFKTKARNFGLALVSGGLAVAADTADKAFNDKVKIDKNKKDKNGKTDKYADYVSATFSGPDGLNDFKKHAEEKHVPSAMIDKFINSYNEIKKAQAAEREKLDQKNKQQPNQNNKTQNTNNVKK